MSTVDITRIAGNISALNSLNALQNVNNQLVVHQQRLSSGKRLLSAADDPAGINIATTFDVRRQGMKTALTAIGDAKNLLANMEGGLKKIQDIMVKMRNKALEATGDTLGTGERAAIQAQLRSFRDEIADVVEQTEWNGTNLIGDASGSAGGASSARTFLTDADGGTTSFSFTAVSGGIATNQGFAPIGGSGSAASASGLGLNDTILTITDSTTANTARTAIDTALEIVKQGISQVGAFSARLTFKEEALTVGHANTEAAYNRIMNANMAEEQVEASKLSILQQTATAMLAQANAAPQFLLQLFR
jgi:flagellin